jgi:hypothetical protein
MYNEFSDKGAHSAKWVEITKDFLKLAFAGDHREDKCLCNRYQNRKMLLKYEMYDHISKQRFTLNYPVWHQHGEVQASATDELDENDYEDQIALFVITWY